MSTLLLSLQVLNAGEFYTPSSIVKLLVEMIEPYKGRIYDPCCGSGECLCKVNASLKNIKVD